MHYLFRALSVLGLLLASTTAVQAAPAYGRLYVFGDSYSDTGAGYLDGNGPTAVAYLAQKLKVPFTHAKDPKANSQSINFAVTAAGSGEGAGQQIGDRWLAVGMQNQVEDFAARVRRKQITFNPATTLFFIEVGLNDQDGPAKTTTDNLTRQIETLKSVGARHFSLALLPTKIPAFKDVGLKLNPAYRQLVPALRKKLGVDLQLNQFGLYLDDILEHPSHYGIVNTTSPCAGRALFNEDTTPCAAPDTYFYFHGDHPSTAVNKIVGDKLHAEISATTR
jgi:phospholipase/lecithinase/hemolysin